jgi:hypothetical protein
VPVRDTSPDFSPDLARDGATDGAQDVRSDVDVSTERTDAQRDFGGIAEPYVWVVIQDTEQKACSTNGPGADIDAVAKMDATGAVTGWGMIGKAFFTPNPLGNACENVDCSGGNCKYAAISKTFTEAELVARTEGPVDGQMRTGIGDDVGYLSLNAGILQIQIGDAVTGAGPAQAIKAGDWIAVYEVDQTYPEKGYAPSACVCAPEHYTVSLQTASGKVVQLRASRLESANATACEALTATSLEGCGTTVFAVP